MVQRKYQEWLKHWQSWQISLYSAKYSVFLAGQSGLTTSCNVSKRAWSGASNPKLLKRTAAPWPARVSGESSSGSWDLTHDTPTWPCHERGTCLAFRLRQKHIKRPPFCKKHPRIVKELQAWSSPSQVILCINIDPPFGLCHQHSVSREE